MLLLLFTTKVSENTNLPVIKDKYKYIYIYTIKGTIKKNIQGDNRHTSYLTETLARTEFFYGHVTNHHFWVFLNYPHCPS